MAAKDDKPDLEQLLSSYIDGTCSDQERQQVEEALRRDPRLRALYAELRRTVDAIRAVPSEAAPGHVRERILAQLERRALLGVGTNAAAPKRAGGRRHSTAWLSLLAAAMLVAGVGATWWIRMHEEKAPMQIAMAPTPPTRDERVVVREALPQAAADRAQGVAGQDRAAGKDGAGHATKIAEAPSPDGHGLPPAAVSLPPPVQSRVPAQPRAPMGADRGGEDSARSAPPAASELDRALAMAEQRGGAPSSGKPEAVRTFGREMATNAAPAVPHMSVRSLRSEPAGTGDRSRLVGDMARSKEALPADAPAAAPMNNGVANLAGKDTADLAANDAASEAASVPAPMLAEVPAVAMAQATPARSTDLYWGGSGRVQEVAAPTVTQLQVNVRDVGQQLALTCGVIREWVRQEGGQTTQSPGAPMIVAAVPPGSQGLLTEMIKKGPGVLHVQSVELPGSHPLARQVSTIAAEQQWLQPAWQFVGWAASWQASGRTQTRFSSDFSVSFQEVPQAPRIIPQDHVPLVIVLQPVAPAAASEPANQ